MRQTGKTRKERRAAQDEDSLLRRIAKSAQLSGSAAKTGSGARLRVGVGDDAALWSARAGQEVILKCDWFLEGVHFLRDKHPADSIGWKCLARAVSDVAAMGGVPRCCLLSLALPASHTGHWLDEFLGGLRRAARRFDCVLAGGDTTRHRQILINMTVIGEVEKGRGVLRSGARPGDLIYVSGRLGEAELGLGLILGGLRRANKKDQVLRKHLYPAPRLALGRWLAKKRLATAMMDLSDGLSSDLPRLCAASGVGAEIAAAKIPAVRVPKGLGGRAYDPPRLALDGGDDYELLFTISKQKAHLLPRIIGGVPVTAIGEITRGRAIRLRRPDGGTEAIAARGWDPFR